MEPIDNTYDGLFRGIARRTSQHMDGCSKPEKWMVEKYYEFILYWK